MTLSSKIGFQRSPSYELQIFFWNMYLEFCIDHCSVCVCILSVTSLEILCEVNHFIPHPFGTTFLSFDNVKVPVDWEMLCCLSHVPHSGFWKINLLLLKISWNMPKVRITCHYTHCALRYPSKYLSLDLKKFL